jgi:hypothetical protein
MKTWLVKETNGSVYRHNEFGDEPLLIGELCPVKGNSFFYMSGDNKVLDREETKQISNWLDEMIG